jgi:hypothetical protein
MAGLVGRSPGLRVTLLAAPSHPHGAVAYSPLSSPLTVAGPRPIFTAFPFHPSRGTLEDLWLSGSRLSGALLD